MISAAATLALLTFDGLLLAAFGLGFTPMYAGVVPVPVGVLFAVGIVPWLVLRAGEIDRRPEVAAAPLVAWALGTVVLGLAGPGGDILLPPTWQSALLFVGGLFSGLWALRRAMITEVADES